MSITYPDAIRKLRAKLNMSQEDLANILCVSVTTVNRWENGHFQPTIIVKEKLKELFKDNGFDFDLQ